MIVLGLHLGHDGGAAIVRDGRLVCAISSERLSRHKKSHGLHAGLLETAFAQAGITAADIDAVAVSDWHQGYAFGHVALQKKDGTNVECTWNEVFGNNVSEYDAVLCGRTIPAYNVGHHLCHVAAAYYTSPFDNAVCLSMDASGGEPQSNGIVARGDGNQLTAEDHPLLMVGLAYGFICEWLGLGSQMFKAGAMMGLASYGTVMDRVRGQRDDYVRRCFFAPNSGQLYRAWNESLWRDLSGGQPHFDPAQRDSKQAMDIAATMQFLFEEAILERIKGIGGQNICLGGGSFLNCNVNSRIRATGRNVHLFPACSDDGCATGAALYVAHHLLGEPRAPYAPADIAYLGPERADNGNADLGAVARAIADGKVVGWFQGRSECGPRALGNRSILADPRSPTMRQHINSVVKRREWFRPLAPSVLAEQCGAWFDFDGGSPYMLLTAKVKSDAIPAVTHVDGTSRMQTVTRAMNPAYYDLIGEFHALTGVPMVLNTSLNGSGQPLAETEADARQMFGEMPMDLLVLNGEIITR